MNKILVLSTPRSSSTSYSKYLCDLHNLSDLSEPFYLTEGYTHKSKELFTRVNQRYFSEERTLLKCHAGHIAEFMPVRPKGWFQDVVDISDEIHFIVRQDPRAQIKSLFVAAFHSRIQNDPTKHMQEHFHEEWQEELVIPDTPEIRAQWRRLETVLIYNLVSLSTLYHMLIDRDPKVVWSHEISDLLPRKKYQRPVRFEWEPEYMLAEDNFFPADVNQIFKANQECF